MIKKVFIASVLSVTLIAVGMPVTSSAESDPDYASKQACISRLGAANAKKQTADILKAAQKSQSNREKQVTYLKKKVSKLSPDAKKALNDRLFAIDTKLSSYDAQLSQTQDPPTITDISCSLQFDYRLYTFWPLQVKLLTDTKKVEARLTKAGPNGEALLKKQAELEQTIIALQSSNVAGTTSSKTFLAPYKTQVAALVKQASKIKRSGSSGSAPQQDASGLILPPNFKANKKNSKGYYLLPNSPGNRAYLIHTKKMPGHQSTSASPASKRYGSKEIISVFYQVAVKYHDKYPDSKLVIGDVNAPGHASHKNGIDMDVYTSDRSAALIPSLGGNKDRSVELGKMFMDTGKVQFIFFNSPEIDSAVNGYAQSKGLSGNMQVSNPTHEFHMHVRIAQKYAGPTESFASSGSDD